MKKIISNRPRKLLSIFFRKRKTRRPVPMAKSSKKAARGKYSLQHRKPDLDMDLISDLPRDVYNAILVRLPITDAARTSILSRKLRCRWASIPHLVFDWTPQNATELELVGIVNAVLLVHDGPVHKFVCSYCVESSQHIDRWILFLSKHGIKQFTLRAFVEKNDYLVHSCLFSCQELSDLDLSGRGCIIKPPPAFEGFRNLGNLCLEDVSIADDELERLISKCPLLETLTLENLHALICIKINAPNLHHLRLSVKFRDLCITNSPLLITADIQLQWGAYDVKHLEQGGVCNLIKVLGSLHHIESLNLQEYFPQFLSIGDVPDVLPTSFLHLKDLSMTVSFMDSKEAFTTLCMLRSSPNLEKLNFTLDTAAFEPYSTPIEVFWEAQEHLDCPLNHLRTVEMTAIMAWECELYFVRFLLANAPVLEKMSLRISKEVTIVEKSRFLQDMLRLRRASAQAIISCDYESSGGFVWLW